MRLEPNRRAGLKRDPDSVCRIAGHHCKGNFLRENIRRYGHVWGMTYLSLWNIFPKHVSTVIGKVREDAFSLVQKDCRSLSTYVTTGGCAPLTCATFLYSMKPTNEEYKQSSDIGP